MQTEFVNPPVWREGTENNRKVWWYQVGHETYIVILDGGGKYRVAVRNKIPIIMDIVVEALQPVFYLWDDRYDVDVEFIQKCITDTLLDTVELPLEPNYLERYTIMRK